MNVIVAGDFAPRARLAQQIKERKFCDIFPKELQTIIKSADYSLVNFESPVIEDTFSPIKKCGPNLGCSENAVEAIKYAGFKCVTLANNHILDYGDAGLNKTVECCQKWEIDVVGVGANLQDAEKVLYVEENGKKLAIINCCEHEFSIASRTTAGANPLNPIAQFYKIKEAKQNADFVLVVVHGGHEHFQLPSMRMQETYRFFVDAGADAVVNHHQHCYSGYEIYKGKPIFYGLGNFCFDWDGIPQKMWTEGYFVEIKFDKEISFNLYPYCQYGELSKVMLLKSDFYNFELDNLNKIIGDEIKLNFECDKFFLKSYSAIKFFLNPIRNKFISYLYHKRLFPSLINKMWLMDLLAIVRCESWRDKLVYYLNKESK